MTARREEDVEALFSLIREAVRRPPVAAMLNPVQEADATVEVLAALDRLRAEVARLSGELEHERGENDVLRWERERLRETLASILDYSENNNEQSQMERLKAIHRIVVAALSAGAESEAAKEAGEYFDQLTGRDA